MTVLVTGASGFIGARLVADLGPDAAVVGSRDPGRDHVRLRRWTGRRLRVDPADAGSVAAAARGIAASAIVHTAHERSRGLVERVRSAAAQASAVVAGAAHAEVDHVVVLGSAAEYGAAPTPQHELGACTPTTGHGVAKLAATATAVAEGTRLGVPVTVLRPTHVSGVGEPTHKLVPRALAALAGGAPVPVVPGAPVRDVVHVDDVVAGIRAALGSPPADGLPVNLCSGDATSVPDLLAALGEAAGRPVPTAGTHPRTPFDDEERVGAPDRAAELLGWRACALPEFAARCVATWPWSSP